MKIFYIDKDKNVLDKDFLLSFGDKKFLSEEKEIQHCLGRYLVKTVANNFFKLDNSDIVLVNKKPRFKSNDIHFSISHSQNIIIAAFDKNPVGVDIEFMKDRNFKELFKRYNYKSNNISKELFYSFWTEYEAAIKLQGAYKTKITVPFAENFMLTVLGNFNSDYQMFELVDNQFSCV